MIRYTPTSQLSITGFETPFAQQLSADNRWVILAGMIPWDKLAAVYYKKMRADFGAPKLSARLLIGAVIIKHMLNIDDREVVEQIRENIYLQYFVGLSSFQTAAPFDASLMVSIRKRLGKEAMGELNELILREAGVLPDEPVKKDGEDKDDNNDSVGSASPMIQEEKKQEDQSLPATPSGTLLIDATVAEQQIEYPTDIKLLNEAREQLERMIDKVCQAASVELPRMYRINARKKYLLIAKKKCKSKREIRRGIRQQLQYVKRDLKYINTLLEKHPLAKGVLKKRDWKLLQVISELYRQQAEMYKKREHKILDRIVNIYQPHVRPMPRGKDRVSTEFGSKQLVMLKDGYTHVALIGWDNYNEGPLLKESLEKYKQLYGCYPEKVLADQLFGNRENRRFMTEQGIRYVGKPLGRPTRTSKKEKRSLQKEMAQRNPIEGKFGQGKNAYGLAKIRARLKETSESWVLSIYFIMNLLKLAEASFLSTIKILVYPALHRIQLIMPRSTANVSRSMNDPIEMLKTNPNFYNILNLC